MTAAEIVNAIVADPSVYAANTRQKPDGSVIVPTAAELKSLAEVSLQTVLGELILDQSIARALLERSYTLTTAAGTDEYTLPDFIERIVNIRRSSDKAVLKAFGSKTDFDLWYSQNYGSASVGTTLPPIAYYESGRQGLQIKVSFAPGAGSETSLLVRYVRRVEGAYDVAMFPTSSHGAILIGAKSEANGGRDAQRWAFLKSRIARALEPIIGGVASMRHDDTANRIIWQLNAMGAGYYSDFWDSSKRAE